MHEEIKQLCGNYIFPTLILKVGVNLKIDNGLMNTTNTEKKQKFVQMRAKGYPYSKITKELNVSKATLTAWSRELQERIAELKAEFIEELYEEYFMLREARIKQLGNTLKQVSTALESKDLSKLTADKLLDYKLKYIDVLKNEFIETEKTKSMTNLNGQLILIEFVSLLQKVRTGEITIDQAVKENKILSNILNAYETLTLEKKIEALGLVKGGL